MKRYFQRLPDPRFALTTLQNPNIEVRACAQLVQAAQPFMAQPLLAVQDAAKFSPPQPLATPAAPDSVPTTAFAENVASTAPAPRPSRQFLLPRSGSKNARNSPENNALNFSNRLKTANCSARFSRVLRPQNHDSPVARRESRSTTHQSRLTDHAFLIASRPNIKNRRK